VLKFISAFFAIWWTGLFIAFVFGDFKPSRFDVGVAFLISGLYFLRLLGE